MMLSNTFGPTEVIKTPMSDGGFVLSSATPLGQYAVRITDHLVHWASVDPGRRFLAQRGMHDEWEEITYGDTYDRVRAIGQYLLNAGCGPNKPVAIVSENSIQAACFTLGAIYAGIPVAPISPAYATVTGAFEKLQICLSLLNPALVYAGQLNGCNEVVARALGADEKIIGDSPTEAHAGLPALYRTKVTDVDVANSRVHPDSVAKYLFTSGSTGQPKAVINTHRMLCANQKQLRLIYPFIKEEPPVLVDWLPWSHTFGGNEVFFLAMANGGQLYIDRGKPVAQSIDETIYNLKAVSPTIYFNVPVGYEQLVSRMEYDAELKKSFFARLRMVFYAAAGMPQRTWTRLEEMSIESAGRLVAVVTAWGATETAPLATGVHFESHRSDNIGVPVPGCEIRLAPINDKFELRVRGPNVMPGYLGRAELNETAFDEENFYRTGDAGSLVDEENPAAGIVFEGRIAEDFKLQTGTWVSVGRLRGLLSGALMPLVTDVVIVGSDREYVSLLLFLNLAQARAYAGEEHASMDELAEHPRLLRAVQRIIDGHNEMHPAPSMNIRKFKILIEPPSAKKGEITDKGSINQAAVAKNRASIIEGLYEPDNTVLCK